MCAHLTPLSPTYTSSPLTCLSSSMLFQALSLIPSALLVWLVGMPRMHWTEWITIDTNIIISCPSFISSGSYWVSGLWSNHCLVPAGHRYLWSIQFFKPYSSIKTLNTIGCSSDISWMSKQTDIGRPYTALSQQQPQWCLTSDFLAGPSLFICFRIHSITYTNNTATTIRSASTRWKSQWTHGGSSNCLQTNRCHLSHSNNASLSTLTIKWLSTRKQLSTAHWANRISAAADIKIRGGERWLCRLSHWEESWHINKYTDNLQLL